MAGFLSAVFCSFSDCLFIGSSLLFLFCPLLNASCCDCFVLFLLAAVLQNPCLLIATVLCLVWKLISRLDANLILFSLLRMRRVIVLILSSSGCSSEFSPLSSVWLSSSLSSC
ncbi:hypothetical protein Drorol1_Dr00011663 [Drosera rotundifolia]